MSQFIYSIKEIFNTTNGCLFDYKANGYFIAPYQRGYKWKSNSIHDQIPVFILDIYEAFLKSLNKQSAQEYYLQYITVIKNKENLFEVIDGQQRLTTITLLFNVLEQYFDRENICKLNDNFLLTYSRYEKEKENIFNQILLLIEDNQEAGLLEEQDKYYMLKASQNIKSFFEILKEQNDSEFKNFIYFLENNVKLILNKEDEHTTAEEVFANLNDNKVPLTNAYLIKGLLLTKASRINNLSSKKNFKEIIDERAIMGRMWDEMNTWFSKPEIALFLFGEEQNGMEKMLTLIDFNKKEQLSSTILKYKTIFESNKSSFKNPFILFNDFHENIISAEDSLYYLNKIKHTYKRLKSWYNETEYYNLIGFKQAVKRNKGEKKIGNIGNIKKLLEIETNQEVLDSLIKYLLSKIPTQDEEFENLGYGNYKKTYNLLLALNVFPQIEIIQSNAKDYRFDFYSFISEKWSLEHIFPRNPNTKNFNIKDDKKWILSKINEKIESNKNLDSKTENKEEEILKYQDLIEQIKSNEEIVSDEINFMFEEITDHDTLGNMALLSKNVNSSLSNSFFNTKRRILLRNINKGSFVPKHTIDAFSKMMEVDTETFPDTKFDDSLTIWSANDIEAHHSSIISASKFIHTKYTSK